ncbi:MAG: molybdenum cofactor guanylyltransferase [Candidatus Zixiibacteriota bacterium]|nr:MAG: molybdenum cofactor guanylyltransferase [candidate division Zixibacteria bacterium]
MTGIILAGGKNTRIAEEKAFIQLEGGQPLIARIIKVLKALFPEILIVANKREAYRDYDLPVVQDLIKGKGPLGGIFTGRCYSTSDYNFVVGCDMPFIEPSLVEFMVESSEGYDVVIPAIGGDVEPLFALYSKSCLPVIFEHLMRDNLKTREILDKLKVKRVGETEVDRFDPRHLSFFNLNTPADQKSAEKLLQGYASK